MLQRRHAPPAKFRRVRRRRNETLSRPPRSLPFHLRATTNHSRRDTDARAEPLDRLRRRRPEVPFWVKQVDLHRLAARPGVPELLRVERALGGAGDLNQLDAEMPA